MVALKIFFGSECRRCNSAPSTYDLLNEYILTITGLSNPLIQYQDEEEDLITITTDVEYQDFLLYFQGLAKLLVSPSKIEQSSNTFPVFTKSSASLAAPRMIEQSISTRVVTEDKSQGMPKPKMQESGCDPEQGISKIIETIPLETSSVLSGPPELKTSEKFTKTKSNLLESIRCVIREEMGKGPSLKVSGINLAHRGIQCDGCKISPILGIRYKCSVCEVNFCEQCEYSKDHPHPFFKVRLPEPSQDDPSPLMKVRVPKPKKEEEEKKIPPPAPEKPKKDAGFTIYQANIKKIIPMGFTYDQALSALIASSNCLDLAIEDLIFNQGQSH